MSLFGNLGQNQQQKPSLFGSLNTNTSSAPSGGLFGASTAAAPASNLFGGSTAQAPASTGSGLFGSATQQPAATGGLFGSTTAQPQQSNSLFGATATQQPQQTSGLFGSTAQKPATSLFGGTAQPQQQTSSLFGQTQQQQQSSQQQSLFGGGLSSSAVPQQNPQASIYGASQIHNKEQQFPPLSSASVWQPRQSIGLREKVFQEQVETLALKWLPDLGSKDNAFQHYFYNSVPEDQIPYYTPGPQDDDKKWEEALQKKPSENSIPVLARGFRQIGERLRLQHQAAVALQQRLHQINESLSARLQKHDTESTVAAAKARQRHQVLSRRCLSLATKVQVLRNRGYALDRTEEELRQKLLELEKQAADPVLMGRQEEIWARMTIIRDRAAMLERETKGIGKSLEGVESNLIDEDGMKTIKKILNDYDSQMAHLSKEIGLITKDFEDWEATTKPNGTPVPR